MYQSKMCFSYVTVSNVRRTVGHVHEFSVPFVELTKAFGIPADDLKGLALKPPREPKYIFVVCSLLDCSLTAHISTSINTESQMFIFSALIGSSDRSVAISMSGENKLGILAIEQIK